MGDPPNGSAGRLKFTFRCSGRGGASRGLAGRTKIGWAGMFGGVGNVGIEGTVAM